MDNDMIDMTELGQRLKKRWIVILFAALVCGLLFNIYGVRKENSNIENAEKQHLEYMEAVDELPGYYTETLYNLRSRLSSNAAEFAEAYANIYKSFLKEYQTDDTNIKTDNLEAYMMFLDSYKDVLSVMSGTQREYYEMLISADTNVDPNVHPIAEPFERSAVSALQPVWLAFGVLAGAAATCVVVILGYTFKKTARPSEEK
jgi:hypothetical protein